MLGQGLFFLMHMAFVCTGNSCLMTQTAIRAFGHPDLCKVAEAYLEERIPNETFYCVQFNNI